MGENSCDELTQKDDFLCLVVEIPINKTQCEPVDGAWETNLR